MFHFIMFSAMSTALFALFAGTAYFKFRSGDTKSIFFCFFDSLTFIPYVLGAGRFSQIDVQTACLRAVRKTGLKDFDDKGKFSFIKLYAISEEYGFKRSKSSYTPMGFFVQQLTLQLRMEARLRLIDYCNRHPSVEETKFSKPPTIITGFTRTGTTYLHELISIHPEARAHATWEQMSPVPTTDDESDRAQIQNRIERHKKGLIRFKFMELCAGDTALAVHKVEYDKCEECTLPCSLELPWNISNLSFMMFAAEELFPLGAGRTFDLYLKFLKLQTWSAPDLPSHWVLKCPFYLPYLDDLHRSFPKSTIVWTHRDPVEFIASTCLLFECTSLSVCSSWTVDKKWLGRNVLKYTRLSFDRAFTALDKLKNNIRIIHVKYRETVKDTLKTCKRVCELNGLPFTEEYASILEEHITNSRAKRKGATDKYNYTLEEYGMTKEEVKAEFKEYIELYC